MLRSSCSLLPVVSVLLLGASASAQTVVFWEEGFPTVESRPIIRNTLVQALGSDTQTTFTDAAGLHERLRSQDTQLLVLPYGSAFPASAWGDILSYLRSGGNLLVLGGQPLRVPVVSADAQFTQREPQDTYSRELGILHTYEVPQKDAGTFKWRRGYEFWPNPAVHADRYFVLEGRGVNGLGYMLNPAGDRIASPVVVLNHVGPYGMSGGRWVMLDFVPSSGYWSSSDGVGLIRRAAGYARAGSTAFSLETAFSTLKPGETPQVVVHLRNAWRQQHGQPLTGTVKLELRSGTKVLTAAQVPCSGNVVDANVDFEKILPPGFYALHGVYEDGGQPQEFYGNGFWVEDEKLLNSGPALGTKGDFLTEDGKPFFPFGTNYFSTESNGWDFSGPRNADVWDNDFAEMEKHNVTFVRTGVWGGQSRFVEGAVGVSERFLRNVEAFLLCARRHNIAVNFTFFAFDPQSTLRARQDVPVMSFPGSNPYLDPVTIHAEQDYMLSVVNRFKNVPYLCWDLINEPSFSNPKRLWHGNTPNNDGAELSAWHAWLRERYKQTAALANAWSVPPTQISNFDAVALPDDHDLSPDMEGGTPGQARAFDYNLFAQDMFSKWVQIMSSAIHATGSRQLIDVGQDEGGVETRVLNQFYGKAGVSFTTNHTYRANSALLWDSLAAKLPGVPAIVGETGYQPVILPNGDWQFDEITGFGLLERKWASGFAAGASGLLSWDWDREIYFGLKRSDGSDKTWMNMKRDMGEFAKTAAPYATGITEPEVVIVLPQSLQLSTLSRLSIAAQQACVRALYGYARSEAYAVGEYQIPLLGNPKLIIVPSPWMLGENAWEALLERVKGGATLLISGRFDRDPHFLPTGRQNAVGLHYQPGKIALRENRIKWPEGEAQLQYDGSKTDFLERAFLPNGETFVEKSLGAGKILFAALPLELNDNEEAIGQIYGYALKTAGVVPVYSSGLKDAGVLICPTRFPHATLYVITSESPASLIAFRDEKSGKTFSAQMGGNRAALLLVGDNGQIVTSYNWNPSS